MKTFIYLFLILFITSCEKIPYLAKEKTETPKDDVLLVPKTLKKGQKLDIQFTLSKELKQKFTTALNKTTVYSALQDKDINITKSYITCLILLKTKNTVITCKEFDLDKKSIEAFNIIKQPIDIWSQKKSSLKPGDELFASISFKYFYQTSEEKMREQLFNAETTIHYLSKKDLKQEQSQLKETNWMQKLKVLKELDPFSLRFGFIAGAVCVILLIFAAKVLNAIHRGKTAPGVHLPGSQSTFITTRAVFDLVQIELAAFTHVKLLNKGLYKLREGFVIKLDIAYDLSQSDFPDIERRLKEHLLAILKSKLGLENIADIRIDVKKGTLD